MNTPPKKNDVSAARQRLIEIMRQAYFGRIEGLVIRDGEPVFDPHPLVVREHKFGGINGPRGDLHSDDFLLNDQIVDLLQQFDQLQNVAIAVLEVKNGLPFRMFVCGTPL